MLRRCDAEVSAIVSTVAECAASECTRVLGVDRERGHALVSLVLVAHVKLWNGDCVGQRAERRIFGAGQYGLHCEYLIIGSGQRFRNNIFISFIISSTLW